MERVFAELGYRPYQWAGQAIVEAIVFVLVFSLLLKLIPKMTNQID